MNPAVVLSRKTFCLGVSWRRSLLEAARGMNQPVLVGAMLSVSDSHGPKY